MYYDRYTEAIYNWLITNRIAEKIDNIYNTITSILNQIDVIVPDLKMLLMCVTFFGFLFFGLKFVRFRGFTL